MVYFVGAGPGAEDLITVRGLRLIQKADVIIYAGSLVNPGLLDAAKQGCEIHNSAYMTLEEVLEVICRSERLGKDTVRLHTGDGSIYGAIREQMEELKKKNIPYEVCPGVSSFLGAAASLNLEYTLPGVSQSVIITRAEGRTGVPERERLASFASHHATMVLFLSSSLAEKVKKELIEGGYEETTPAAIVYKATWPEEKKFLTTLGRLPETMRQENITKTALIIVGDVLGHTLERSKLYDPSFSTEFRPARAVCSGCNLMETEADVCKPELLQMGAAEHKIELLQIGATEHKMETEQSDFFKEPGSMTLTGSEQSSLSKMLGSKVQTGSQLQGKKLLLIACSRKAYETADRIRRILRASVEGVQIELAVKTASLPEQSRKESLKEIVAEAFPETDCILFVTAAGIAVRTIAPLLQHKSKDPAVLVMDETGRYCIPVLSGHAGGANAYAEEIAGFARSQSVITTATDCEGKFSVDEFARRNHLVLTDWEKAKEISRRLLEGETVTVCSEYPIHGEVPEQILLKNHGDTEADIQIISTSLSKGAERKKPFTLRSEETEYKEPLTLRSEAVEHKKPHALCPERAETKLPLIIRPQNIILGIGCKKGTDAEKLEEAVRSHLQEHNIQVESVRRVVTIDLKAGEPGLVRFAKTHGLELKTFTADELNEAVGEFADSDFVKEITGTANVCERSCAADGGRLISHKTCYDGVTVAAAELELELWW